MMACIIFKCFKRTSIIYIICTIIFQYCVYRYIKHLGDFMQSSCRAFIKVCFSITDISNCCHCNSAFLAQTIPRHFFFFKQIINYHLLPSYLLIYRSAELLSIKLFTIDISENSFNDASSLSLPINIEASSVFIKIIFIQIDFNKILLNKIQHELLCFAIFFPFLTK